jgi:hypothetical protein
MGRDNHPSYILTPNIVSAAVYFLFYVYCRCPVYFRHSSKIKSQRNTFSRRRPSAALACSAAAPMASYPRSPHLYGLCPIIFAGVVRQRSRAPHNYRVPESASNPQALPHLAWRLSAATVLFLLDSRYLLVLLLYRSLPLEMCSAIVQWSSTLRCICAPSSPILCPPDVSPP